MNIKGVLISKKIVKYLEQRNLGLQYKKAKKHLLSDRYKSINFKKRKPKASNIWSFRISKKYRAFGYFDQDEFIVSKISDHQD